MENMAVNYREKGETATSETVLSVKAVKADLPQRTPFDPAIGGTQGRWP
jgi:hypothetical protein